VNSRNGQFSDRKTKGQIGTAKQPEGVAFSAGAEIITAPNEDDNMLAVIGRCK